MFHTLRVVSFIALVVLKSSNRHHACNICTYDPAGGSGETSQ